MKEGSVIQQAVEERRAREDRLDIEKKRQIEQGLRFLDKEIKPLFEEVNATFLQNAGEIFLKIETSSIHKLPVITLEWGDPKYQFESYREVKKIEIYYRREPLNYIPFGKGKRPSEPVLTISSPRSWYLQDGKTVFIEGPIKRKQLGEDTFEEGDDFDFAIYDGYDEKDEFFYRGYRKIRKKDWLPIVTNGIIDAYETTLERGVQNSISSAFHRNPQSIEELTQTIEIVNKVAGARRKNADADIKVTKVPLDKLIADLYEGPKSIELITHESVKKHIPEILGQVNEKVFHNACKISAWEEEREEHEHTVSHGYDWSGHERTTYTTIDHKIEADVLRFWMPNGRLMRFFIHDKSLFIDRHNSASENQLCLYTHDGYDYRKHSHREGFSFRKTSTATTLQRIIFRSIAEDYSHFPR